MTSIQAVIGANYGDEGKGYLTDVLCHRFISQNKSCLVLLSNGGAQRGHTVETPDGKRFIFHHLGSGSFLGAASFFCSDFILNPLLFSSDWEEFSRLVEEDPGLRFPLLLASPDCRFSTPYDMIANQILEDSRGSLRHGSVGAGIWETVRRYDRGCGISMGEMAVLNDKEQYEYLLRVRSYMEQRIEHKLGRRPEDMEDWGELWSGDALIFAYLNALRDMLQVISFTSVQELAVYDIIVIENAQGILLTQDRYAGTNHTTPSDTGAREICRLLKSGLSDFVDTIRINYVTRSYLTKHGAGFFAEECSKEDICSDMRDLTNVPNNYQGTLRYGHLDIPALARRLKEDMADMEAFPFSWTLTVTHLNEYPLTERERAELQALEAEELFYSDGHTRDSMTRWN